MKKKTLLTVLISILLSSAAFSQFGFKGGFAFGKPVNDGGGGDTHLGFDVGVTYDITESIRGEVLFEGLFNKTDLGPYLYLGPYGEITTTTQHKTTRIFPITVGADYRFLTGMVQPYAGLNLGIVSIGSKSGNNTAGESHFGLYPKAGVNIEVADNLLIDVAIKYYVVFDKPNDNDIPSNSTVEYSNTQIFGANIGLIYVLR